MTSAAARPTPLRSDVAGDDALPRDLVRHELARAAEAGHDTRRFAAALAALEEGDEPATDAAYERLLDELELLPGADDDAHRPSGLEEILALLPEAQAIRLPAARVAEGIRAAWTGRVVGNVLGKPVENGDHWTPAHLDAYLRSVDAVPLDDYIPVSDADAEKWGFLPNWPETTRGRVSGSSRDDDVDYTILNLHLLREVGPGFAPEDVAAAWLQLLPYRQTYSAERATYRNLVRGVPPLLAGGTHNPYREWIGALIRGDVFGMVFAGDPRRAATTAWKDAILSHRADGVYGEMWAAALVSAAFAETDVRALVTESLRHVPPRSGLAGEVCRVLDDHAAGSSWEDAVAAVHARHRGRSWVHVLNNAGLITAALLWGEADFSRSIGLAVRGALDTDSNAATVGCVAGILAGPDGIADRWTAPIGGVVRSAIFGYDGVGLDDLISQTIAVQRRAAEEN